MIKLQETLLLVSGFALMFAQGAGATEELDRATGGNAPISNAASQTAPYVSFVSVEAFYGAANDELFEGDLDKLNIGGISIRRSYEHKKSEVSGAVVLPEFYFIGSVGGGSLDQTWYYGGGEYESQDCTLISVQIAGGANLRCYVNERFSVFGGVRLGAVYESIDVDSKYQLPGYGTFSYSKQEGALGLLYGIGAGAELRLGESSGLTFGIDYVASTAQPEFNVYGTKIEADEQSYVMFSVGAKFLF